MLRNQNQRKRSAIFDLSEGNGGAGGKLHLPDAIGHKNAMAKMPPTSHKVVQTSPIAFDMVAPTADAIPSTQFDFIQSTTMNWPRLAQRD